MNKLQAYLCSAVTIETAFQHFFCHGCEECPAREHCQAQPEGTCCRENFFAWAEQESPMTDSMALVAQSGPQEAGEVEQ